jgi:hypothetical protein
VSEQGKTFAAFVEAELKAERERRTALDARGVGLVTTSGSLTTLLAAVGAFVSGRTGFQLPSSAAPPLVITLLAFALASGLGLLASHNRKYAVADAATLAALTGPRWATHEVDARSVVAQINARTVSTLRLGNDKKSFLLIAGLGCQLVGLVSLAVAVLVVLATAG